MSQSLADLFTSTLLAGLASSSVALRREAGELVVRALIQFEHFRTTARLFAGRDDSVAYLALQDAALALLRRLESRPLAFAGAEQAVAYLRKTIRHAVSRIFRLRRGEAQTVVSLAPDVADPKWDADARVSEAREEYEHFAVYVRNADPKVGTLLDACREHDILPHARGAVKVLMRLLGVARATLFRWLDKLKRLAAAYFRDRRRFVADRRSFVADRRSFVADRRSVVADRRSVA